MKKIVKDKNILIKEDIEKLTKILDLLNSHNEHFNEVWDKIYDIDSGLFPVDLTYEIGDRISRCIGKALQAISFEKFKIDKNNKGSK